mgnify:CR=1 FL=1
MTKRINENQIVKILDKANVKTPLSVSVGIRQSGNRLY